MDGERVVTLAEHSCLVAAGLQYDATWCVVINRARLVCLRFYGVLQPLRAAVLLQCNAASALDKPKIKLWQLIGICNCRSSKLVQCSVTIACAYHFSLAVLLGCFMRSVARLNLLHVSCGCNHCCMTAAVATAIVLLSRRFIAAPMLNNFPEL